jgi:myo-inositol-1(or 4)-monophosphatase
MRRFDPEDWLAEAARIAREAGDLLLEALGGERSIELKGEIDLVTEMDRRSERLITGRLQERFPGTRILAEEGTATGGDGDAGLWIVDPLDGTTNYAHGFPVFCVSMALERAGCLELGVVHDPTRGETFSARRGDGARLNDRPLGVSRRGPLGEALLATGFPYDIRTSPRNNLRAFGAMARRARGVRRAGSAALDLAYVAAGRLDGYWEEKISPWDVAAGVLLVLEAGGTVTDYAGRPADIRSRQILASNGRIHAEMSEVLRTIEEA